ncbi:MAG: restriction endonuclease subunit S [Paludibacteraceae bacterium]
MPTYPTYKLGEIAKIYNGNSINAEEKEKKYKGVDGRNYIGTKDIDFECSVNYNNGVKIPYDKGNFKIAPAESVLVCAEGGSAGKKSAFITEDVCFGNKLFAITNNQGLFDGKYVFYYTRYKRFFDLFKNELSGLIGGVSSKKFGEIPIPLPPLATQRAIVSRIETLFAELDKAVQHLRTAQQQLKTYRQAVLNHWLNNEDGKWEMVKLGEVLQKIEAGKSFRCNEKVPALHEKGIVKISAVTWGEFMEDECKTIINEDLYNPQFAIHKGDLLISRANTIQLVGNCVLVRKEPKRNIMLSDKVLRLVIRDNVDSDFILYSLRTSKSRTQIQNMSTGNQDSMRNIGQDRIKKIEIPLPPLTEQQHIVAEIERRLSQATASETYIENALQQAEALRQSILKKAFSGELV